MRKAKSLLGLTIITQVGGHRLGTVRDLIFTEGTQKLVALLLTDRELFGMIDATCVPWTQVREIGPNAIMVESEDSAQKVHADPVIAEGYDARFTLDSKQVTTDGGEKLGSISDVYLDDAGHILGYEVSGGLFADAFNGKRYMEAPPRITMGQDVIIVPQDVAIQLERDRQQANNSADVATTAPSDSNTSSGRSVADSITGAFAAAKEKVTSAYENVAEASVEKQREYVVGKTAGHDVVIPAEQATMASPQTITTQAVEEGALAPTTAETLTNLQKTTPATVSDVTSSGEVVSGEVLVRKGELITAAHADRAIASGVLASLVTSATGGAVTGATTDSQTSVSPSTTAASSEPSKLETAAVGKPSAREVLAPDGSVLVAPGMIVTSAILARADQYGKKNEVLAAAGMGAVSQNAQVAYGEIKESAQSFWGQLKEKTSELTGMAQARKAEHDEAATEKKIKNALGRPVTRVILAKDDSIILNTGDIVTNRAIEQARESDVLEILLDSVFESTPQIAPEMLRANESGKAALPSQIHPDEVPPTTEEANARAAQAQATTQ